MTCSSSRLEARTTRPRGSRREGELDERSGGDWRIHDLRRTAASGMAQLAVAPHIIERVLNHTTGTLSGVAGIATGTATSRRCA